MSIREWVYDNEYMSMSKWVGICTSKYEYVSMSIRE